MRMAAALFLLLLPVPCAALQDMAERTAENGSSSEGPSSTTVDLSREGTLAEESKAALALSDYVTARAKATEAVASLLARAEAEQSAEWLALLDRAGRAAWDSQDAHSAKAAWQRVLEVRSRTLPEDDRDLQVSCGNLANALRILGDLQGAKALQEKVLEVLSRTLSEDHPDLQRARLNLASTLSSLGDLQGARALDEKVLEIRLRTLPGDSPDLQRARANLAATLQALGDLHGARALQEQVLEVFSRTLRDDHPDLQVARGNLAASLFLLGDLQGARTLQEQVLEVLSRTLSDDHPDLQVARGNLALTLELSGDLRSARMLQEKVLEVRSRTLGDDHPSLQVARLGLAATIKSLGDLQGAQALEEKVLEVYSRTLDDDHPGLQAARTNLAATLQTLGDLQGARALQEKVLEVRSRTLLADHPDLQMARGNLANTMQALGDFQGARALQEKVLEVFSRTLSDDHPDLQTARESLALTIQSLGDLQGALALQEKVLEVRSRTLPDDHPDLQLARMNLAVALASLCASSPASSGQEEMTVEKEELRTRFGQLVQAFTSSQRHAHANAILDSSSREAEERISSRNWEVAYALSFADGLGVFESASTWNEGAFLASETARSAALASARLAHRAQGDPEYGHLRRQVLEAGARMAELAQGGASANELAMARGKLDQAERELVRLATRVSGVEGEELDPSLAALSSLLEGDEAFLCFRRYEHMLIETGDLPKVKSTDRLCAFVLGPSASGELRLQRIDLGPIEPVEHAVDAWRQAIGMGLERGVPAGKDPQARVQESGRDLRARILDPLAESLAGSRRVIVALDDVLHGVPLDALPAGGAWEVRPDASGAGDAPLDSLPLGTRIRFEFRQSLIESLTEETPISVAGGLVALGGAAFDSEPEPTSEPESVASLTPRSSDAAGILRGGAWERGFTTLPETRSEIQGIRDYFEEAFAEQETEQEGAVANVLERRAASRENLFALAPKARFLHIATHGWFASESIRSFEDAEPLDKLSGLAPRMSGEERVRGMSPMLLCGIALAGANLPADASGRIPGLVTAEELATLDLTNCELAVLSACDTNVGVRRAGQGVASLQRALHMAGARSVITSLWKVPDEATKELMVDFYRRIWVEKKPKHLALWEAKMKLRNAKDERGNPLYTTRDWAAWVLTGSPD